MILDEIAAYTKERVAQEKEKVSLEEIKERAQSMEITDDFPFEKALRQEHISFICEVKKASPSKGLIAPNFPYVEIAKDYEQAGAAAISVLTEPKYFQGCNEYLQEISENVKIPLLRKDFTVDEYMIYEAKTIGASAILLICAILSDEQLKQYIEIAHSLGLSVLVEAHTAEEVQRALQAGARIVGVNNRDLQTFHVDITTSVKLRELVPENIIYVSESGMKTPQDIATLRSNQTDAVLIGETLMRSENKAEELEKLRGDC